jgi:hypothetical protein
MTQVPAETNKAPVVEDNEDAPLPEVPHLPRATEKRVDKTDANGKPKSGEATREAQEPDSKSDK